MVNFHNHFEDQICNKLAYLLITPLMACFNSLFLFYLDIFRNICNNHILIPNLFSLFLLVECPRKKNCTVVSKWEFYRKKGKVFEFEFAFIICLINVDSVFD